MSRKAKKAKAVETDEARAQTAAEKEDARKKAIKKNMAGNLGEKCDRVAETRAGKRDVREQPDFEDHLDDEPEEVAESEE